MRNRKLNSRKKRMSWLGKQKSSKYQSRRLTARQQDLRISALDAINRLRRGQAKTLSAAARIEGTTLRVIRRLFPAAINQDHPGARIRVKKSDPYSAKVRVLAKRGAVVATAQGSSQRELAGQHRATVLRVLRGEEPASALEQYRGKRVGGHELVSSFELLSLFSEAGDIAQLDSLYVSPDASV